MLKEMNAAVGTAGTAEEKSNKSSPGHILSVWGRKAVLAGMIFGSILMAEKACYAADNKIVPGAQAGSTMQKKMDSGQLAKEISTAKEIWVKLCDNEVKIKLAKGAVKNVPYNEFAEISKYLKESGAKGILKVQLFKLPEGGSRRLRHELAKDGTVMLYIEKKELIKILDLAKTKFPYRDAELIFRRYLYKGVENEKLLYFEYSDKYPEECRRYVENLAREMYKMPVLGIFYPNHVHKLNKDIDSEGRQTLQLIATKIIKSEYGKLEVSPEEAVIALNKWISNNIIRSDMDVEAFHSYYTALLVIKFGCGVCLDHANLLGTMCNSIGIPANLAFVGEKALYHSTVGIGDHAVTQVYLEGKGWVIFDPLSRCIVTDEHYTRETYSRVLPLILDNANPDNIIWNFAKPIK